MVSDARGESYEEKLKVLGLTSLRERRERGDMIETFKTMRGINKVVREDWFDVREEQEQTQATRSNTMVVAGEAVRRKEVVRLERANLEIRRHSFTVRAGSKWNELPELVKEQKSVNAFKNQYDKWKKKNQIREEIEATPRNTPQWREESQEQFQN